MRLLRDLARTGFVVTAVTSLVLLPAYLRQSHTAPPLKIRFVEMSDGQETYATAINDRGDYVGSLRGGAGYIKPFVVRNGKMQILPLPDGMQRGVAGAINDEGVVVGNIGIEMRARGARWRNGTVDVLTASDRDALVKTISRDGTAAGYAAKLSRGGPTSLQEITAVGVIWKKAGEGAIRKDFVPSAGNQDGTLAGETLKEGSVHSALLKKNKIVVLPAPPKAERAIPMAISNNENIVGAAIINASRYVPILWSKEGAKLLPVPDDQRGIAYGINDQKIAVGVIETKNKIHHAAVWKNGRVTDMNDLIDKDSGWTLVEARGINNKNQIVGTGVKNGRSAAFVFDYKG